MLKYCPESWVNLKSLYLLFGVNWVNLEQVLYLIPELRINTKNRIDKSKIREKRLNQCNNITNELHEALLEKNQTLSGKYGIVILTKRVD